MEQLFTFKGRIGRSTFFGRNLLIGICTMIPVHLILATEEPTLLLLAVPFYILGVYMYLANLSKRAHDINLHTMIGVLIAIVPLLNLMLLLWPGSKGHNKYGPSPTLSRI